MSFKFVFSKTTIDVIILVVLAIGVVLCPFFSYKTFPEFLSYTSAILESSFGSLLELSLFKLAEVSIVFCISSKFTFSLSSKLALLKFLKLNV